jgi:hypothetical protein
MAAGPRRANVTDKTEPTRARMSDGERRQRLIGMASALFLVGRTVRNRYPGRRPLRRPFG